MSIRKQHRYERHVGCMNVTLAFVLRSGTENLPTLESIQAALVLTSIDHPILRCCIAKSDPADATSDNVLVELSQEQLQFNDGTYIKFEEFATQLPGPEVTNGSTVEKARLPAQADKTLFVVYADRYIDGCAFNLVINHGFTDGTSIFHIGHSFCGHLSNLLSGTATTVFDGALGTAQTRSMRDLIAEVLDLPAMNEPEDARLTDDYTGIMTFPKVTDHNVGRETNGCIRAIFVALDASTTQAILANCRLHHVSFQSLLSSVATLALVKLLQLSEELTETKWNAPIVHMVPVNLRRYLKSAADGISASMAAGAIWKQPAFQNATTLLERLFWSDLVAKDVHAPLNDVLASPLPLQYLHRLNTGKPMPATSVVASSVGNINVLQPSYGSLRVDRVYMQAGFYAASMEAYANPAVPAALINSGAPGFVMLHAYTVFGELHLSGSYYAYDTAYIRQYYDEVVRLLTCAGSAQGQSGELKVGDIFQL